MIRVCLSAVVRDFELACAPYEGRVWIREDEALIPVLRFVANYPGDHPKYGSGVFFRREVTLATFAELDVGDIAASIGRDARAALDRP